MSKSKKVKKPKKVPARKILSRLHKKADKAVSLFVRAITSAEYKGKCPLCGRGPLIPKKPTKKNPSTEGPAIQCCFHFVRRKRKILRWDLRNLIGACHTCNYNEYRDPDLSRAWYIRRFGVDQYLMLVDKSVEQLEPTIEFLQEIIDRFTNELETLESFNDTSKR